LRDGCFGAVGAAEKRENPTNGVDQAHRRAIV
jgi:hypothetical protein